MAYPWGAVLLREEEELTGMFITRRVCACGDQVIPMLQLGVEATEWLVTNEWVPGFVSAAVVAMLQFLGGVPVATNAETDGIDGEARAR